MTKQPIAPELRVEMRTRFVSLLLALALVSVMSIASPSPASAEGDLSPFDQWLTFPTGVTVLSTTQKDYDNATTYTVSLKSTGMITDVVASLTSQLEAGGYALYGGRLTLLVKNNVANPVAVASTSDDFTYKKDRLIISLAVRNGGTTLSLTAFQPRPKAEAPPDAPVEEPPAEGS